MIHEETCTYEVAKLAKEKGFPQAFNYNHFKSKWDYYNHKGELNGDVGDILKLRIKHKPIPEEMKPIAAPTQSLLQRWLREEKNIHISVEYEWVEGFDCWTFWAYIKQVKDGRVIDDAIKSGFNTYELALEDALKESLVSI